MPITTERLLDLLEQRELLPRKTLTKLRAQLKNSDKSLSASKVARRLVDRGLLTDFQAKDLLKTDRDSSNDGSNWHLCG